MESFDRKMEQFSIDLPFFGKNCPKLPYFEGFFLKLSYLEMTGSNRFLIFSTFLFEL